MASAHDAYRDAIIDFLNLQPGVVAWANDTGVFLKKLPNGKRVPIRKPFGTKGVPDVLGWRVVAQSRDCGQYDVLARLPQFIGIDVKMGRDKLSSEQLDFAMKLTGAGGIFIEARCKGATDFGRMTRFEEQWKGATE